MTQPLLPTPDSEAAPLRRPASLMGLVLQAGWRHQIAVAILSAAVFLLAIVPIELQRQIINDATTGWEFRRILLLCLVYIGLALLAGGIKLGLNIYRAWVGERATLLLRGSVGDTMRKERAGQGEGSPEGIAISMMIAECEDVGGFVGSAISEPLLQGGILCGVFGYMAYMNPLMAALSFLAFVPQLIFVPILQSRINQHVSRRIMLTRLISIDIVHSAQSAGRAGDYDQNRLSEIFGINMGIYKIKFTLNFLMNLSHHSAIALILGIGGWHVVHGMIDIGLVVAFMNGFSKVNDPWGDLVSWYRDVSVTRAKYKMIRTAMGASTAVPPIPVG